MTTHFCSMQSKHQHALSLLGWFPKLASCARSSLKGVKYCSKCDVSDCFPPFFGLHAWLLLSHMHADHVSQGVVAHASTHAHMYTCHVSQHTYASQCSVAVCLHDESPHPNPLIQSDCREKAFQLDGKVLIPHTVTCTFSCGLLHRQSFTARRL